MKLQKLRILLKDLRIRLALWLIGNDAVAKNLTIKDGSIHHTLDRKRTLYVVGCRFIGPEWPQ